MPPRPSADQEQLMQRLDALSRELAAVRDQLAATGTPIDEEGSR
jgi:hypothetical protein